MIWTLMDRQSESVNSLKFVADKVCFMNKLSLLSKATSDDEKPTPGYLYQEVCNLSMECESYCNDLVDYLVSRLEHKSYHVKLKVLRIMRFVVENSTSEFSDKLKRKAHGIRDATKFGGPPDPLHGNAPYILVRKEAKELCTVLFDTEPVDNTDNKPSSGSNVSSPSSALGGMGSGGISSSGSMQGFGSKSVQQPSLGASLAGGLKDLAMKVLEPVVSDPMLHATSSVKHSDFNRYKPVQLTASVDEPSSHQANPSNNKCPLAKSNRVVKSHKPGVAGGGWEDSDEEEQNGYMTRGSLEDRTLLSSEDNNKIYDSRCDSPESENFTMEHRLVMETVNTQTVLLKRTCVEDFIKRCVRLNCSKITEVIGGTMFGSSHIVKLHCLQLCEAILRTDLVSPDEFASVCKSGLCQCYQSEHGQTKVKARKIIRILEKLCSNPDVISDVITDANCDINKQTAGNQHIKSSPDIEESSFDFIKTPFATSKIVSLND